MGDLPDYGSVEDGYHRQREYEEAEHLLTQEHRRADTLIEHRPARPDPKPPKREPRRTGRTDQLWRWKLAVLERDQGCCVHLNPADCREGWQAHHVVAQQELRRTRPDALWNPLSGMGVCGLAHRQHHLQGQTDPAQRCSAAGGRVPVRARLRRLPGKTLPVTALEVFMPLGWERSRYFGPCLTRWGARLLVWDLNRLARRNGYDVRYRVAR